MIQNDRMPIAATAINGNIIEWRSQRCGGGNRSDHANEWSGAFIDRAVAPTRRESLPLFHRWIRCFDRRPFSHRQSRSCIHTHMCNVIVCTVRRWCSISNVVMLPETRQQMIVSARAHAHIQTSSHARSLARSHTAAAATSIL